MNKELMNNFFHRIDKFDDKNYLLSFIAYNTAPAIAKQKASYLIIFHEKGKRNLYNLWEKYKKDVKKEISMSVYELKRFYNSTAVLFYNEEDISKILSEYRYVKFLKELGYSTQMSVEESLLMLKKRYKTVCPHEIGVFLGYPMEDVIEFIKNPDKQCLMFGYWKVYHNNDYAKKIFQEYDQCKEKVASLVLQGVEPSIIMNI
ncbi:DUF3793 family protein [Clostridium sp. ZS2-4]|uniref:DUF3793 family protein n=1 Tax=Clostridium sp. ZS2-4 TaxID=2987703 RepID=UPI00227B639C|nr:DUF3793 family protein [Clostridium sp. ZS2-4]MCY6353740.1 DUF3793 family protein [Clostridium sp. ZS2-4]